MTIDDGKVTITGVDSDGQMKPLENSDAQQATMLVGSYVASWTSHETATAIGPDDFDQFISDAASAAGMNTDKPFMFSVVGEFSDVRLHVIHGACPIHARMQKIDLPQSERPFESTLPKVRGKLIGVYAKDAVGKLTHPATSTHVHILFENQETGAPVTAHVEQIGLLKGATLMLAK
ncbi:hypothetical protein RISK_000874 [Rhodopirellula islandica]|uniref:Uncharacterized protein n=1 Tax=Rhodopirellula islandica TaxID=595434 RepID=A0A0J1BKW4_RHOIS|nr:hypothetical protein RISK_000874 [Rhodopirellula islandica]